MGESRRPGKARIISRVVGEIPAPFCRDNSGFVIRPAPARMALIESQNRIVMSSISSPGVIQGFRRHGVVTTAVTRLEVRRWESSRKMVTKQESGHSCFFSLAFHARTGIQDGAAF
jgi:hypothetical protein